MLKQSLILILLTFFFSFGYAQQTKETKTILILFGLSPAQPAYRPILDGIRQKLTEEFGDRIDLHMEYFEIENYPKNNYPKERFDMYNEKYKDFKLDLLICVGRNAVDVIKNHGESYFLNFPTISVDFDYSNLGFNNDLRLNDQTAVVGIKINIDKMISTALSIFPTTSSIYFIGGTTPFDKVMMSFAKESVQKTMKDKTFTFMTDLSMDKILHQVNSLPDQSIIFVPSFNTDSKMVTYYNPEAIRLISRGANSPVFAYSDMGFGEGSVGGYILSFIKVGLLSGQFAVKILNGADPNSFKVIEQDYYENVFDWRELLRWGIQDSELLPKESIILFKEINLVEEYKWIIGSVLLFVLLQSVLIGNLIRLNKNQKIMTKKIIESENRYREFLHEDRSLRLGQLTASLSHELNQPLTAILSTAQAGINFINSNQANPELLKEILQKIVDNDKRGASILSSIRGMMKLERREKEKVNLNALINEVIAVYNNEAVRHHNHLNVNLIHEPVYVTADGIQIQQVLLNLIFNASQALEKAGTSNKVITISNSIHLDEVIVSIQDNGSGIDETIKEKLFKPFITSKTEGMGIGLVICQSIIEDHEGKIRAENLPEGGAKFSFSLKISKDEQKKF
ncbi:MAG: ATP-binding protein [Ignavibacteriales bacterium]